MTWLPEPLHTRMLTLRLASEGSDAIVAEGRILDLRKRGVVALGGTLKGPGVVHDMHVRLVVDRTALTVRAGQLRMAEVPFPNGPTASGETCRDNEAGFERVVGLKLGPGFAGRLQRTLGGPRGCFHVFTVLRLLGPSMDWALAAGLAGEDDHAFERTVVVDGSLETAGLALRGTLADMRIARGPEERLAAGFQADAEVTVDLPGLSVGRVSARYRAASTAPWSTQGLENTGALAGASLLRTYGLSVGAVAPARGPLAPVHQLLLMLQPVGFQCMPALAGVHAEVSPVRPAGPVAAVDSCSMWRRGGPLLTMLRERTDARPH